MESQLPESTSLSNDQENQETPENQENPLLRRYPLALDVQDVEKAREVFLRKRARTVKIPGFRPGKAPFRLIEQEYGEEAREKALINLVHKSWEENTSHFNVASLLDIEEIPSPDPEKRAFVATFEVFPEFELADVSQLSITRSVAEVTEKDIDQQIHDLRMDQGSDVEVDRSAQFEDYVTLSYSMTLDGVPLPEENVEDIEIALGEQESWKAFDEEIVGLKAGESKDFDFIYPEDTEYKHLVGKTMRVHVTVSKVEVWTPAELDADFAKENGIDDGDLDALRVKIRKELEEESTRLAWMKTKDNVLTALLEAHMTFAVPESLVRERTQKHMDKTQKRMAYFERLKGRKQIQLSEEELSQEWESLAEEARREIRLILIFQKLSVLRDVPIPAKMSPLEAQIREDQIIQWVLDNAQVVDAPASYETLENWYIKSRYC
jgi:trigger factor